ncbi:C40 family peptidase [Aromatoleum evansii]|uniref:C40 family peptidase n=1 Tax=Aromatoleum evansii TaxID=59406 RepID=A0ABZ1AEU6_AROEV|nr:C40 family peptidase [Aromatoleum evansii]
MVVRKLLHALTASTIAALVAACSSVPAPRPETSAAPRIPSGPVSADYFVLEDPEHSREMVIFALGLLDTGYRFGGRNPDAGLDCSGMVSYIVEQVSGRRLPHNAAQIADRTRPVSLALLQPGDLVFFNTMNRPYSHMGIYMGEGRFVHAPSSRGRVRVERLDSPYFRSRFDGARTLLADS